MEMKVIFSCGHEAIRKVRGQGGPATMKSLDWWKERQCTDCWKADQAVVVEEASADLPILDGSEKQVSWANRIRIASLTKIEKMYEEVSQAVSSLTGIEAHQASIAMEEERVSKLATIKRVKSARFWIDTREDGPNKLLSYVDSKAGTVTTVWYAKPVEIELRSGRRVLTGGTKPHYTEQILAEVN
jgi:hypothetical protein